MWIVTENAPAGVADLERRARVADGRISPRFLLAACTAAARTGARAGPLAVFARRGAGSSVVLVRRQARSCSVTW
ncbi:hypothetical protein NUM_01220 [Actinocatenispora comari]|uniref:Uncharacterized protein n=1 Tax=Actinocatenispora comari TaxID=2807577 RepID=A0A8J4A878_9ACTN|nr:hypothetical protein NUM_01220 [Actinocatenispora comari]